MSQNNPSRAPKGAPWPLDPAWVAIGGAALVLMLALLWLLARPAPQQAAAPAAQANAELVRRLEAAEAALAQRGQAPAVPPELLERLQAAEAAAQQRPAPDAALTQRLAGLEGARGEIERETEARIAQARRGIEQSVAQAFAQAQAAVQQAVSQLEANDRTIAERLLTIERATEATFGEAQRLIEQSLAEREAAEQALARQITELRQQGERAVAAARQQGEQALAATRQDAERRITALTAAAEARAAEARQQITAAFAQRQQAEQALAQRLAALEARLQQETTTQAQRLQRLAAVEATRAALDRGQPLGPSLQGLGPNPPPALARFATQAPPSEAALRASFEEAARGARGPQGEGILPRLSSALTIRRGEETVVGDPMETTLERARRALDAADLEGAVRILQELPTNARNAMRNWSEQAEAVIAARNALRGLAGN
jgi:hypothetical protein